MRTSTIMRAMFFSLAIAISSNTVASDTAGPDAVSFQFPALLTACQVKKGDKYFSNTPILVLAFVVNSSYSVLYERDGQEDKFLAEMHYDEGGLDAQGGVWSEFRAEDVYDYLSKKAFFFISSKEEYQSGNYFKNIQPCEIKYIALKKYEEK